MAIVGEWWNELGSKMVIVPMGVDPRIINGTYHTAVGTAKQRDYNLSGACDAAGLPSQTLGWAVAFDPPDPPKPGQDANAPSTCAWSGQYRDTAYDGAPLEFIVTTWILTDATSPADNWASTKVGKNYFFRNPPTAEQLNRAISVL